MLKVKFIQYKKVVIMEILEQSDKDTDNLYNKAFIASNDFRIDTECYPEIAGKGKIFVRGSKREADNVDSYNFISEQEAECFIKKATLAIKEYNSLYKEPENPENLEITIAE